jgi:hypothetical protein
LVAALLLTDTDSMLPFGGVVEGLDPSQCTPFWDNELLDPDFAKFTSLARSAEPVATLSQLTAWTGADGRPMLATAANDGVRRRDAVGGPITTHTCPVGQVLAWTAGRCWRPGRGRHRSGHQADAVTAAAAHRGGTRAHSSCGQLLAC